MINRLLRVNVLLQREISDILHRLYQQDSVTLTVTEVRCAPDLRTARVFISVVGDADHATGRMRWLSRQAKDIRLELARRIVLKYLPRLDYVLDDAAERGTRIVQLLDELEQRSPRLPQNDARAEDSEPPAEDRHDAGAFAAAPEDDAQDAANAQDADAEVGAGNDYGDAAADALDAQDAAEDDEAAPAASRRSAASGRPRSRARARQDDAARDAAQLHDDED